MITPASVNAKYISVEQYFVPLQKRIAETLSAFCEKRYFALVSRVKTLESLSEKIESGRFATWADIDDLIAFAIVIPTLSQEEDVISFLANTFRTVALKRRGSTPKAPDVFRYDSTRFVGRLPILPGETSERPIDQITFEIQVRTAFDHAWVVTTHALSYKSAVIDWKQQRLAAELKATSEKMDLLILAFQEASSHIGESPWPAIAAKRAIQEFFADAAAKGKFPSELIPKDWSRFTDNIYSLAKRCDRKLRPNEIASLIIDAVNRELDLLGPEKVPLSLSLWQFTLGSLTNTKAFKTQLENYWPLITPQLEELYPPVKALNLRFDFEG